MACWTASKRGDISASGRAAAGQSNALREAATAQASASCPAWTNSTEIGSPLDFVGINVYRPSVYVEPSDDPTGYRTIPISASHPKMKSGWPVFDPEVMYWAPRHVHRLWDTTSIYITENGCAGVDELAEDGRVYDTDRVMFLRACLRQLQRAAADGVPVHGYYHWSAPDNLEWNANLGNRFGIVYVDFETLERTPKLSAEWFREAARQNAVV